MRAIGLTVPRGLPMPTLSHKDSKLDVTSATGHPPTPTQIAQFTIHVSMILSPPTPPPPPLRPTSPLLLPHLLVGRVLWEGQEGCSERSFKQEGHLFPSAVRFGIMGSAWSGWSESRRASELELVEGANISTCFHNCELWPVTLQCKVRITEKYRRCMFRERGMILPLTHTHTHTHT